MALDANVLADAIKSALGYDAATAPADGSPRSIRGYVERLAERTLEDFKHPTQEEAARADREASINALANAIAHGVAEALVAHMAQADVVLDADVPVLSPSGAVIGHVSIPRGKVE